MDVSVLLGPLSGLTISLYFSFRFLTEYKNQTKELIDMFRIELEACNARYDSVFKELMLSKGNNNAS